MAADDIARNPLNIFEGILDQPFGNNIYHECPIDFRDVSRNRFMSILQQNVNPGEKMIWSD